MRVKTVFCPTIAGVALFLAGCSAVDNAAEDAKGQAPVADQQAAQAAAVAFERRDDDGKGGSFQFDYDWPAEVSAIPALQANLTAERTAIYDEWLGNWKETAETMPDDCTSCRTYSHAKAWQVVADLPRFLSLSARVATYSGGAHGMLLFDALVWDREAGARLKPVDMFRSPEVLSGAVRDAFCAALDKERRKKRGAAPQGGGGMFDECIDPVENSVIILGSGRGQRFDRIGFLIPPYNAGPYAEGAYEVTLDVTPALLDTVRPEYRRAFQVP